MMFVVSVFLHSVGWLTRPSAHRHHKGARLPPAPSPDRIHQRARGRPTDQPPGIPTSDRTDRPAAHRTTSLIVVLPTSSDQRPLIYRPYVVIRHQSLQCTSQYVYVIRTYDVTRHQNLRRDTL